MEGVFKGVSSERRIIPPERDLKVIETGVFRGHHEKVIVVDLKIIVDIFGVDSEEKFRNILFVNIEGEDSHLGFDEDGFFMESRHLDTHRGKVSNSVEAEDGMVDHHPWLGIDRNI